MTKLHKITIAFCMGLILSGKISYSMASDEGATTPKPKKAPKHAVATPISIKSIEEIFDKDKIKLPNGAPGIVDKEGNKHSIKEFSDWLCNASDAHDESNVSVGGYLKRKKALLHHTFTLPNHVANALINGPFVAFVTENHEEIKKNAGVVAGPVTPEPIIDVDKEKKPDTGTKTEAPKPAAVTVNASSKVPANENKKTIAAPSKSSTGLWIGLGLVATAAAIYIYKTRTSIDASATQVA